MGTYGGFYKGERRKLKKKVLEKKAIQVQRIRTVPQVEILGKKGK